MKKLSAIVFVLLVSGGATQIASASLMHAAAQVKQGRFGIWAYGSQWASHNGVADKTKRTAGAWVHSHAEAGYYFVRSYLPTNFYGAGHAHHHDHIPGHDEGTDDGPAPPLPEVGSPGSILSVEQTRVSSSQPGMMTFTLLANSFVQVDMDGVAPGDSIHGGWLIDVDGLMGRVILTGTIQGDGSAVFAPTVDGILSGMEFSLAQSTSHRAALSVAGMQLDVPGNPEDLAVSLDTFVVPVPEPSTGTMVLLVLAGLSHVTRRWPLLRPSA